MLKIIQTPTYTLPVEVDILGSGRSNFDVEFKRLSKSDIQATYERMRAGELDDRDLCHELVVGWGRVEGASGKLEFSAENLDKLLEIHPIGRSILDAFFTSLNGAIKKE